MIKNLLTIDTNRIIDQICLAKTKDYFNKQFFIRMSNKTLIELKKTCFSQTRHNLDCSIYENSIYGIKIITDDTMEFGDFELLTPAIKDNN